MQRCLIALLAFVTLTGAALSQDATDTPEKVRILILDGQNNHDFVATTQALKETLSMTGRFLVDVSTSPPTRSPAALWDAWRPDFSRYAAVVSNYNGQMWPEPVQKAFLEYMEGGGGVVFVHAANNAFPKWEAYERMCGLLWRPAAYGPRVTLNDEGQVVRTPAGEGPGAGHGPQHAYVVTVRDPEHPIMKGLPTTWMHAKDELYHGQRGPAKNMRILSTAYSDKRANGTGTHEPITWWIPFGEGRAVTTVLGHHWKDQKDFDALHCVGFQLILARCTEWAATKAVTIPLPKGFPSPDATSIVEPVKVEWR